MKYPTLTCPKPKPTLNELTQKLFVYGTLRPNNGNACLLTNGGATHLEEVWLYGHAMYGTLSVYPAESDDRVRGDLWEVPTELLLGSVDLLEGHPYAWIRTWVSDQHGGTWIYIYNGIKIEKYKQKDGDINKNYLWNKYGCSFWE